MFDALCKKKYIILFIFAGSLLISEELWESIASVTPEAATYFNRSNEDINWFSNVFLITLSIQAIPSLYFPNYLGLKYCIIVGAIFNTLGCLFRCISTLPSSSNSKYILCMAGNVLSSIAQGFNLNLSPYLSSVWFEQNERNLCTGIVIGSSYIGIAIGFFLPCGIFKLFSNNYGSAFRVLFFSELIFTMFILVLTFVFIEDKPKFEVIDDEKYENLETVLPWRTLMNQMLGLFKRLDLVLILITYGLFYATSAMFYIFYSEYIDFYLVEYTEYSGFIASGSVILGSICIFTTGYFISRLGSVSSFYFGVFYNFICMTAIVFFLFIFTNNKITLMYGIPSLTNDAYGLERLSEFSYPFKPYVGSTAALIFGTTFSTIFIYTLGLLENGKKYIGSLILAAVSYFICLSIELYFLFKDKRPLPITVSSIILAES